MRPVGFCLIAVGVIWVIIAFNMDTSVSVGGLYGPGRVENIGLMAQRQNHLLIAALVTLIGTLLAIFGGSRSAMAEGITTSAEQNVPLIPPMARDLSADKYRLWLAAKYGIKRNELFDKFVFHETMFDDLESALRAAHDVDVGVELQAAAVAAERAAQEAEQRAAFERDAEQHKKADLIAYVAIGSFIAVIAAVVVLSV